MSMVVRCTEEGRNVLVTGISRIDTCPFCARRLDQHEEVVAEGITWAQGMRSGEPEDTWMHDPEC